jgi:hypothetical protein
MVVRIAARDQRPDDQSLLFHCLVPAARWWADRLSPDWWPHTREHHQALLDRLGLTGAFWRLPDSRAPSGSRTITPLSGALA